MDYTDQLIWITGASSGIGEALAKAFSRRGARLVLTARNTDELARVRSECAHPDKTWTYQLDMLDQERMPALAAQVLAELGPVSVLINNAGITSRGLVKDTLLEVDKKVMEVNYFGTIALTKALLPSMAEQQKGLIVTVSSVIGKFGTAMRSSYAASKHALHGFFDSLRGEVWQDGIRIVMVVPGYVSTPITLRGLKGDGSPMKVIGQGQQEGIPADEFAERFLRALDSRKEEILIGGLREMSGVYLKRFFPRLLSRVLRKARLT
jgi:dehydrogenase/reductase SDR family member 7B